MSAASRDDEKSPQERGQIKDFLAALHQHSVDYYVGRRVKEEEGAGEGGRDGDCRLRVVAIWWLDARGEKWHKERPQNVYSSFAEEGLRAVHGGDVRAHPSKPGLLFLIRPTLRICYEVSP